MRNYFKFLATAMVAILVVCALSAVAFAASTPFTDVNDRDETLSDAVALLSHLEITKGTSETTFGTVDGVTRQQMAAFIYRLMNAGKSLDDYGKNSTKYTDLVDRTYFGYISWANDMGIINGTSETTFNPKGGIMLQDAYTMLIRALGYEDEHYAYPFTYVTKAEALGLDKGLNSQLSLDSILTRGDMAILLYNAFFTEINDKETKSVDYVFIDSDGNPVKVAKKVDYNNTVAEKYYDIELGEFTVRATTKYAFNESADSTEYVPLLDDFPVDMLQLVAVEDDEPLAQFYCEFDGSGLTGNVDDYIMQSVKAYYTYDEVDGTKVIDEVYFISHAEKTLETNKLGVYYRDKKNRDDYYEDTSNAKIEGKITCGEDTMYFFDAPYSYIQPDYDAVDEEGLSKEDVEQLRYNLRNEKNVKLLGLKCLDFEKGTYSYYVDKDFSKDDPTSKPEELLTTLKRVYSNGIFKMKFFDVDGDDVYEYAYYMPATYGFMNGDDNKHFSSDMTGNEPYHKKVKGTSLELSFVPTIYYNDANISGASFNDGDFVVAYLNPDANIIEVISTIKPYKGYVSQVREVHGMIKIDGTTFSTSQSMRLVENLDDEATLTDYNNSLYAWHTFSKARTFPNLITQNTVGEVIEVYATEINGLNGIIHYRHIDDAEMTFGPFDTIIAVGNDNPNDSEVWTKSIFDPDRGEEVYYARAYTGTSVKYVPIAVYDMLPELGDGYDGSQFDLSKVIGQDGETSAYVDKIAKFVKTTEGDYKIIPLLHVVDEDGNYDGINRDSKTLVEEDNSDQYGNDLGYTYTGVIKKVAGTKYQLVSTEPIVSSGDTLLGDFTSADGVTIKYFTLKSNSRILIKNWICKDEGEEEFEYLEFDAKTFKGSTSKDTPLTNIQYILKGDPNSDTRADLVLLYAEADNFEFKNNTDLDNTLRIVSSSEIVKVADEEFRHSYTLINPYTGERVEGVLGKDNAKRANGLEDPVANGTLIEVKETKLDEEDVTDAIVDTSEKAGLVWITEYNAEEGFISVLPVEATDDIHCKPQYDDLAQDFQYDGTELNFDGEEFKVKVDENNHGIYYSGLYYTISEDTVITVLRSDKPGIDTIENGEFALADISAIAEPGKEFKCYNNKVTDRKGNLATAYAPDVKAYVYADDAKNPDVPPVAEFIIIVVNGEEDMIFTDTDNRFPFKTCDVDHD